MTATKSEQKRRSAEVQRAVAAWSRNRRRACKTAREYLADATKAYEALCEGERGHVLENLKTALRGLRHMLDDIESGKDGDEA